MHVYRISAVPRVFDPEIQRRTISLLRAVLLPKGMSGEASKDWDIGTRSNAVSCQSPECQSPRQMRCIANDHRRVTNGSTQRGSNHGEQAAWDISRSRPKPHGGCAKLVGLLPAVIDDAQPQSLWLVHFGAEHQV